MEQHSFQEVMRQWVRVRKATASSAEENVLSVYPLEAYDDALIAYIEKNVMQWAAEHPEPVYPTWGEWLVEIGAAKRVPIGDPWPVEMADGSMIGPEYETVLAQNERIPADIAEKLGVKPKEG